MVTYLCLKIVSDMLTVVLFHLWWWALIWCNPSCVFLVLLPTPLMSYPYSSSILTHKSLCVFSLFSFSSFKVFDFTYRPLIHFFLYDWMWSMGVRFQWSPYGYPAFPASFSKGGFLSQCMFYECLLRLNWKIYIDSLVGFLVVPIIYVSGFLLLLL